MSATQTFKSFDDLAAALGRPPSEARTLRSLGEFLSVNPVPYERGAFRQVVRNDPCSYCGGPGGTVDHVQARGKGGLDRVENMAGACVRCNTAKGCTPLLEFLAGNLRFAEPPPRRVHRLVAQGWLVRGRGRSKIHRRQPYRLPKDPR